MQQHGQPPFFPFAFVPPQHPQNDNQIPARVRVALQFLDDLNDKTAQVPVSNDTGIEVIEGQPLNPTEEIAQTAALRMLTGYFNGQLQPSTWEQHAMHREHQGHMLLLPCPGCNGEADKITACAQCGGRGKVAIARFA